MKYRWHLLSPALALMLLGVIDFNRHERYSDAGVAFLFQLANFLIIAFPYFVWLLMTKEIKRSATYVHSGFVGAHAALFAVTALIYRSPAPESANGWFYYFALVVVTIPLFAKLGNLIFNRDKVGHA